MKYTIEDIIQSVQRYPHTLIAVDINGSIRNVRSLKKIPEPLEEFSQLIKQGTHKYCSASFIKMDRKYSREKALKKIKESIEALQYSKTHKLKPGVNIPGNERLKINWQKNQKNTRKK